jgi:hypothetical protein
LNCESLSLLQSGGTYCHTRDMGLQISIYGWPDFMLLEYLNDQETGSICRLSMVPENSVYEGTGDQIHFAIHAELFNSLPIIDIFSHIFTSSQQGNYQFSSSINIFS